MPEYFEIKDAEQFKQLLHEKPLYDSVVKSQGNPDRAESFLTRMESLFRAGTVIARFFPDKERDKLLVKAKHPGKTIFDIFKNKLDLVKTVAYYEHPDPTFGEEMSIVAPGPAYNHMVFGKLQYQSIGEPVFNEEGTEGFFKYLLEQQKND